ncbi:two-component sensor histidine kinase [Bradyrhizobium diazoefficiens USDA 110]|uniref:Two-component sensor histidine kinase n=2 Tax=Bradyrhizobium diazoefficiens TaxID=1355477 RepID=Q89H11_BRADU|nr:HAMP domain-containing protein [Bradyrhizobium diazoefficiens]BAC51449.1 two-component sensor histidine kinase [Bradyrhizobium diazoefficiens USDA 110]
MIPTGEPRASHVASCNPAGIAVRFRLDIGRFASVNVIGQVRAKLREAQATPMWQNLSLRARINLLLALLLALGLAVNIGRQVTEAGPRVQAEDQSVIRLAREFIEMIVADLNEAPDPDARLNQIARDLSRLRHVSIALHDSGGNPLTPPRPDADDDTRGPPAWFVSLVHPEQTAVSVPVSIHGKPGSLRITSHPDDEIAEIWDGIVTQLEVGSVIALALFLIMMTVVGRALAPLQSLAEAMTELEGGHYEARVAPGGAPELAAICTKLNHLAATLGEAVEDKRRLAERAVSLQDVERKEIARELHDEFGPYLFSLRAHASALAKQADGRAPSADAVRKHGSAMLEQINALQQFTRRVLERLRPVGLAELGLGQALESLSRLWRESHPDVTIQTTIASGLGATGETADLTIYRVVQEALTNVFRHAGATTVNVVIEPAEQLTRDGRFCALVRVSDNGRGMEPGQKLGFGLVGMRERILALGGTLNVVSGDGGLTVEALVPTAAA